ncbi:uncharacterized protein LOC123680111 isoform X1 [Harmonia axyridis]|uniref:uncharacterized protein LOC123680111 isoform X1 n=1 Tax=Harmonia axyridis TaxID=115357 RepID=UPI001E277D8D|nr:uncharacterized protein LOC123680111 isoform X1 [Harmonia axyridis]
MAYSDVNFSDTFSEKSNSSSFESTSDEIENIDTVDNSPNSNITLHILNRQIYGRFTKRCRTKTEKVFKNIHPQCRIPLSSLVKNTENMHHVFMGFTVCGTYFLSFTEKNAGLDQDILYMLNASYEYELHLWKFQPGKELKYLTSYKIFKQLQDSTNVLDNVMFMQFPLDPYKIICYGVVTSNTPMAYMTILTLPSKSCRHCCRSSFHKNEEIISEGWCTKHGFILHYTLPLSNPSPVFNPHVSLAYPDYVVVNTGHYIHILNINTSNSPQSNNVPMNMKDDDKLGMNFNDAQSEASETISDHFDTNSVVDAIIEDFNEYDLENGECNKPFHELNISCEPLNVTGKSYHNTLVQNIVDPRMKRLQSSKDYQFPVPQSSAVQKNSEKTKIDLKNAEKAYEFIEENEKCEKLSLFRKKRLAEKKYEFSEDNMENIVPFNSLRREKRFFRRCIRSPDLNNLFLSPRSPGLRSPIQSPSSRSGQFSPSGAHNVYCTSFRNSPHHSNRSPISPKDTTRKFHSYSPLNMESDFEFDSRLVMKSNSTSNGHYSSFTGIGGAGMENSRSNHSGLLIVDPTSRENTPKWIKKVVRRYSNGDFENSSLLSGHSRDDYNIPIEIPLIAQTLSDQLLDIVPDFKLDHITQMHLIVTQRTFDCEQFIQRRAQQLCTESQLQFLHCQDYDVKMMHVCPVDGDIVCKATIKIGALKNVSNCKPAIYCSEFIFIWNIATDAFKLLYTPTEKLCLVKSFKPLPPFKFPRINCQEVMVLDYGFMSTKTILRDYHNNYEIYLNEGEIPLMGSNRNVWPSEDFFFDSEAVYDFEENSV